MSGRFRPFSNGTEYMDWLDRNCCRCIKYHVANHNVVPPFCRIERSLSLGSASDGTITTHMADRIGVTWGKWGRSRLEPCREKLDKVPTAWDRRIGQAV